MRPSRTAGKWILLALVLLALILTPFVLFEEPILRWTKELLAHPSGPVAAAAITLLLALDIVMPTPSSLVSTASGALLGLPLGALASTVGMSLGCTLGYALGMWMRGTAVRRIVGDSELARVKALWERHGGWTLVILRPVPVLAEASVIFAGLSSMPFPRFLIITTATNLCISVAYAAAGAYALSTRSFLVAFAAAILLPLIAMITAGRRPPRPLSE